MSYSQIGFESCDHGPCKSGLRVCDWVQGCVEIIYISVQVVMYTMIVYWMCWFQRDAGQHIPCLPLLLCASLLLVAAANVCFATGVL